MVRHGPSGVRVRRRLEPVRHWAWAVAFLALVAAVSALCVAGCAAGGAQPSSEGDVPVGVDPSRLIRVTLERVVDGDTIVVRMPDRRRERVRYIGIDTPELARDGRPAQPLAEEAAQRNAELLEGRTVRLEFDVEQRDRHGRLLAYVWAGADMVNLRLVREGYATVLTVPPNVRRTEAFVEAQSRARIEGLGLWEGEGS